jgi:hypothetical protein
MRIGDSAFSRTVLSDIVIPSSVEMIGPRAFLGPGHLFLLC